MRFVYIRGLNKNEIYPTTKKQLRSVFSDFETLDFWIGASRKFKFDSWSIRKFGKSTIKGRVVAFISYHRDRNTDIDIYPLSILDYPGKAIEDFNSQILFMIKQWIEDQVNKPDTAILGKEELIVEWNGKEHLLHEAKISESYL